MNSGHHTPGEPYIADPDFRLYLGDVREVLAELPDGSVDCCVTSPPYWGLRDYGHDGQIGLEATPGEYVGAMVAVFREVRRVLAPHGTLWLNLGDSYAGNRSYQVPQTIGAKDHDYGRSKQGGMTVSRRRDDAPIPRSDVAIDGLKAKDLVGIPWRVAFALQADGWYLRSDIIWSKPNPMPESVTDRPTKSHEYVFLLSKQARYFYDAAAISEPARWYGPNGQPKSGPHAGQMKGRAGKGHTPASWEERKLAGAGPGNVGRSENYQGGVHGAGVSHELGNGLTRNARSVWEIQTQQYADAHFAVYPEALPERCIKAGCPEWVCECGYVLGSRYNQADAKDDATRNDQVSGVRDGEADSSGGPHAHILLSNLLEQGDSAESCNDQGLRDRPEGLQVDSGTAASDGEPRGLRNGTPPSDGGTPGKDADGGRGRTSQERRQAGQSRREPGSDAEASARSQGEAEAATDSVSSLRRSAHAPAPCPACGSLLRRQGVTLDPFMGAGTTALVARRLGRKSIGVELNEDYARLCARRLQQLSLLAEDVA